MSEKEGSFALREWLIQRQGNTAGFSKTFLASYIFSLKQQPVVFLSAEGVAGCHSQ